MPWSGACILRADTVTHNSASATVRLTGEIDITSVDVVRRIVADLKADTRRIILDLSCVKFCDVAAVRFLVEARHQADEEGTELIVRYPQRSVYRVLELTGALPVVCPGQTGPSALAADSPVVTACEAALLDAIRVSGADMGNAQLVDPATGELRIVAQRGFKRPFLEFFETVHDEKSACGVALMTGEPVWVADVARSPIFADTPSLGVVLGAGARSVASVSVRTEEAGAVQAMISVHCRQPTTWTKQRRQRLAAVAAVTGRRLAIAR